MAVQAKIEKLLPHPAASFIVKTRVEPAFAAYWHFHPEYQLTLGGGIMWLDSTCIDRYGKAWVDCTPEQQTEILDRIAYRKSMAEDPTLSQGVAFFSFARDLTADAFFTSKIGIQYLGYIGNTFVPEWKGCPPVPGV